MVPVRSTSGSPIIILLKPLAIAFKSSWDISNAGVFAVLSGDNPISIFGLSGHGVNVKILSPLFSPLSTKFGPPVKSISAPLIVRLLLDTSSFIFTNPLAASILISPAVPLAAPAFKAPVVISPPWVIRSIVPAVPLLVEEFKVALVMSIFPVSFTVRIILPLVP